MADSLPVTSVIVRDPYALNIFKALPGISRDRDLVFLGRLVSDKGMDLLLDALARLRGRGLKPGLIVIGSGPELAALKAMAKKLEIESQVEFIGPQTGEKLAETLNSCRIMVVPSPMGRAVRHRGAGRHRLRLHGGRCPQRRSSRRRRPVRPSVQRG